MKYICTLLILFFSVSLYGGAVFLKNGSFVEGRILKETKTHVILWQKKIGKKTFKKKNLVRVLYKNDFKKKVFIYLLNGSYIEGHIVDEDKDIYVYRLNLKSVNEKTIEKKYVNFISFDSIVLKGFAPYRKYNPWGMWYFGFEFSGVISINNSNINPVRPMFNILSSPGFPWHVQLSGFYGGEMSIVRLQGGYNFQLLPDTLALTAFLGVGYEVINGSSSGGTDFHAFSLTAGVALPWNIIRGRGIIPTIRYTALFYEAGIAHTFQLGIIFLLY